jgi:hypothetical protein
MAILTEPIVRFPRPAQVIAAAGDLAVGQVTGQAYGAVASPGSAS